MALPIYQKRNPSPNSANYFALSVKSRLEIGAQTSAKAAGRLRVIPYSCVIRLRQAAHSLHGIPD